MLDPLYIELGPLGLKDGIYTTGSDKMTTLTLLMSILVYTHNWLRQNDYISFADVLS